MGYNWEEHNYRNDRRVRYARCQAEFNAGCDFKRETFTFEWGENEETGEPVVYVVPITREVCPTCGGKGSHVNPSIDASGIGGDDEFWDDDYSEDYDDEDGNPGGSKYLNGFYDVTCYTCNGKNVVPTIDRRITEQKALEAWDDRCADAAEYDRVCEAERRYGC